MTFRKQAIATLKQLREDGYELEIKLNASNEALHAELLRLDGVLAEQEKDIQAAESDDELLPVEELFTAVDRICEGMEEHFDNYKAQEVTADNHKATLDTLKANAVVGIKAIDQVDREVITPYVVPRLRLMGAKALLVFMTGLLWLLEFTEELYYDIKYYKKNPQLLNQVSTVAKALIYTDQYSRAAVMWLVYNIIPTVEVEGVRVIW